MTGPRTYGDPCGLAKALDAVGERWALLILRELAYGPRRFTDLRAALGASPNVLTQRLGELEAAGVVTRRTSGGAHYDLSDWGRALHPALIALTDWGLRSNEVTTGQPSHATLLMALEARFTPDRPATPEATIELRLGEDAYALTLARNSLGIVRGRAVRPAAALRIDLGPLARALLARGDWAALSWQIEGDRDLASRALAAFA